MNWLARIGFKVGVGPRVREVLVGVFVIANFGVEVVVRVLVGVRVGVPVKAPPLP